MSNGDGFVGGMIVDKDKQARLEAKGWVFGDAEDFLLPDTEVVMSKIKKPVRYDAEGWYIKDADSNVVCDIDAEGLPSDEFHFIGNEIAIAINEHADLKARLADANRGAQVNALVNESLAKKLKLAVEALGQYADKSNWDSNKGFTNDVWYLTERGWSIADEVLAKIKEPSKGGEQR